MKFYLSGGIEYKKNLGMAWREWFTAELEKRHHDAINPIKLEIFEDEESDVPVQVRATELKNAGKLEDCRRLVRKSLFRKDIFAIQLADAIVVLYDEAVQQGAGTLAESWEAFREGIPVYLVTEFPMSKVPTWLIGETTQIFPDFDELLVYVGEHTHVIRDQMLAQRIKDEILGGIY